MDDIIQTTATGITIHIPAIPNGWETALVLGAFGLALALFLMALNNRKRLRRIRWSRPQRTPWWLVILFVMAAVLSPLWAILLGRTILLTFAVFSAAGDLLRSDDTDTLRWYALAIVGLLTALGGLLAAPLAIIRTHATERQTRTAEENLTTDLINKAVEGLGAQKEVNRLGRNLVFEQDSLDSGRVPEGVMEWLDERWAVPTDAVHRDKTTPWAVHTLTVPNIEVRLGAIYALERIAQDSPRDHIRVMEILCAYLRENAPARDARRHDLGPWPDYPKNPTKDDLLAREKTLKDRRRALGRWITDLRENHPPRADIQAAITVIGRRSPTQIALEQAKDDNGTQAYRLDLRNVTMQAADLSRLNLANAQLDGAHLEGADLFEAHLKGADLRLAHLERAELKGTHLERAVLKGTHLEGANLDGAHLEGADFDGAHLERAVLFGANLERTDLGEAHLERANLDGAHLESAFLGGAHLERAFLARAHLEGAVLGGAHLEGAVLGGAHLERANLFEAHLEGADLGGAHLSDTTMFTPATLRGACLKHVNLSIALTEDDALPRLLAEAFGDASVTLPDGLKAGKPPLEHWSTDTLGNNFHSAWRAHQRAIGYTPPG